MQPNETPLTRAKNVAMTTTALLGVAAMYFFLGSSFKGTDKARNEMRGQWEAMANEATTQEQKDIVVHLRSRIYMKVCEGKPELNKLGLTFDNAYNYELQWRLARQSVCIQAVRGEQATAPDSPNKRYTLDTLAKLADGDYFQRQ